MGKNILNLNLKLIVIFTNKQKYHSTTVIKSLLWVFAFEFSGEIFSNNTVVNILQII